MEIKIGVSHINREVVVETDESADDVSAKLADALASGTLFTVADSKGRQVLVPAAQIAYVELGAETARPVGFGAI